MSKRILNAFILAVIVAVTLLIVASCNKPKPSPPASGANERPAPAAQTEPATPAAPAAQTASGKLPKLMDLGADT
jgi:hypothetical protein